MLGRRLDASFSLIAAATLVACGTTDDVPSRGTPARRSDAHGIAAECGTVPTSSGPLAQLARLTIKAPVTASAGQTVAVSATVMSKSTVPRVITTPAMSAVLVVRDGRVVGRAFGGSAPQVPLQLTAGVVRPAQAIPESVALAGCGSDTGTAVLAAGRYALVAVLGYQLDPLNGAPADGPGPPQTGGRNFALVSAPVPLTVD